MKKVTAYLDVKGNFYSTEKEAVEADFKLALNYELSCIEQGIEYLDFLHRVSMSNLYIIENRKVMLQNIQYVGELFNIHINKLKELVATGPYYKQ